MFGESIRDNIGGALMARDDLVRSECPADEVMLKSNVTRFRGDERSSGEVNGRRVVFKHNRGS